MDLEYLCLVACHSYLLSAIQLRRDVENVTARLHYMNEAKNTVKDDIALTKRATEKTAADVGRAQEEKQKQACLICFNLSSSECIKISFRIYFWII